MRCFDIDKFCSDLSNSELLTSTLLDHLRVRVHCYNSTPSYINWPSCSYCLQASHSSFTCALVYRGDTQSDTLFLLLLLLLLFIIIIFIINNAFVVFYLPTLNLLSLLLCTWDGTRTDSTPFVLKLTNCQRKWIFYLCRWPTRIKKISTCPNQYFASYRCLWWSFTRGFQHLTAIYAKILLTKLFAAILCRRLNTCYTC